MTYGATSDDVSNDSDGATGNNDDVNGEGAMGDYVDDDGVGVMGNIDDAKGDGMMRYDDDDDGDGVAMTTTSMATARRVTTLMTSMATAQRDTTTTMVTARPTMTGTARLATTSTTSMGWEHGCCCHQAYPLPGRWGDDGGIAMTMAGEGLGLSFGGNSSRRQPPAAAATKRPKHVRWEREGGQRQQPMNGEAKQCHATTSKRRGTTRGRGAG
jgi:hypothetical protein